MPFWKWGIKLKCCKDAGSTLDCVPLTTKRKPCSNLLVICLAIIAIKSLGSKRTQKDRRLVVKPHGLRRKSWNPHTVGENRLPQLSPDLHSCVDVPPIPPHPPKCKPKTESCSCLWSDFEDQEPAASLGGDFLLDVFTILTTQQLHQSPHSDLLTPLWVCEGNSIPSTHLLPHRYFRQWAQMEPQNWRREWDALGLHLLCVCTPSVCHSSLCTYVHAKDRPEKTGR